MVAEPWIFKMGSQVSSNLKNSLSLQHHHSSSSSSSPSSSSSIKRKQSTHVKKQTIGILSFEVANVMSKIVHLHKSLSDQEISRLKTDVIKCEGVKTLISSDESYLLELAYSEKLDDLNRAAEVVSRLGKRCNEPALQGFEHVFGDLVAGLIDVKELGFLVKDMDGMIRKMEKYVGATSNLYGELEVLNELEQASKKFQQNQLEESRRVVEQKLSWQEQDVRQLKDVSLWNQTYDKIVELLARTVCTIYARICVVFEGHGNVGLRRNFSGRSAVSASLFSVGGDGMVSPYSMGEAVDMKKGNKDSVRWKNGSQSGPLSRLEKKSPSFKPRPGIRRGEVDLFQGPDFNFPCGPSAGSIFMECLSLRSSASRVDDDNDDVYYNDRGSQLQASGNLGNGIKRGYPIHSACLSESQMSTPYTGDQRQPNCPTSGSLFGSRSRLALHATPSTIGGSAFAMHYANVIIVIEKLLRYPHLVGEEARDDLYQMLPSSLRKSLKVKLKSYFKNLAIYDAPVAHDWKEKLDEVLKWLAPLAHNMIRWQSERNFEQQQIVKRTNVLLLQTLYFADREKTESAICQLLMGLNYICRYEHQQNALLDCAGSFDFGDWMEWHLQCQASCLN